MLQPDLLLLMTVTQWSPQADGDGDHAAARPAAAAADSHTVVTTG